MKMNLDRAVVRKAIKALGPKVRQKDIAVAIGVEPGTLSDYLHGRKNLGQSAQIMLAQVLKLNESDKAAS